VWSFLLELEGKNPVMNINEQEEEKRKLQDTSLQKVSGEGSFHHNIWA